MESNALPPSTALPIGGFRQGPQRADRHADSHHPLMSWASAKPDARLGGNMVGPCDERDATGRCQPVTPTFDPLKPTVDISLKDFGGVRSKWPKVPRTTRRAGNRLDPRRRGDLPPAPRPRIHDKM